MLNSVIELFESGNLPAAVARTVISAKGSGIEDRPADRWSLGNRLLLLAAGTEDARGYKQWQKAGRQVKKGAKAAYIFAPRTKKIKVKADGADDGDAGSESKAAAKTVVIGFKPIPVFRVEDTDGPAITLPDYTPAQLPPLYSVAEAFAIDVRWTPGAGGGWGSCAVDGQTITLHTQDVKTFFHELTHAVHVRVLRERGDTLKGGQHADQEIVAETAAAALCEMYGIQGYHRYSWDYIKGYGGRSAELALQAIMGVFSDVEECLTRILDVADTPDGSIIATTA